MLLPKALSHALYALCYLSKQPPNAVVRASDMARAVDVPPEYVRKILAALCKAGFSKSIRGRQGGYVRRRSLDEISVADVWRAVGLKQDDEGCLERACTLGAEARCVVGRGLKQLQHELLAVFARRTVESLTRPTCSVAHSRYTPISSDTGESKTRRLLSNSRFQFGEVVEASSCSGI